MDPGRVSVVIPLYNHRHYITQAFESVLLQGNDVKELIVIDDGSRDESAAVMDRLAERDSRVRFLRQENQGAHATINRGLGLTSGEFVTILNSDDAYAPGRFAALIRALDLDPGSSIAASAIAFMDGDGRPTSNPWFDDALKHFKSTRDFAVAMIDANFLMTTSNFFMRRTVLEKLGGFAPLRYAHDLDFALRWAAQGMRLCFIDRPLIHYRFHATNTISENHNKVRVEWALCAAVFLRLKYGASLSVDTPQYQAILQTLDRHGLRRGTECALTWLQQCDLHGVNAALLGDAKFMADMLQAIA
jgi:glycosyltransferase involved in cell wall biosynthesis